MEARLVERAKKDPAAFAELYRKYFPKIYTYVIATVKRHDIAEDIVSATFEKALQKLGGYVDKGYSFGAWLYKIAHNTMVDSLRKENRLTPFDDNLVLKIDTQISGSTDEQMTNIELWDQVQNLTSIEKQIVILRYIQGYSIKEVSFMFNKTEDAVKSIAKRALKNLREKLL